MTRILLAEDRDDLRELYTFALKDAGWDVVAAVDGFDALYQWHLGLRETGKPFDVLLLDKRMPGPNGIAVSVNIRQLEYQEVVPRARHYFMTGEGPEEMHLEVLQIAGFADDYLIKPFDVDQLVAMIRKGEKK